MVEFIQRDPFGLVVDEVRKPPSFVCLAVVDKDTRRAIHYVPFRVRYQGHTEPATPKDEASIKAALRADVKKMVHDDLDRVVEALMDIYEAKGK